MAEASAYDASSWLDADDDAGHGDTPVLHDRIALGDDLPDQQPTEDDQHLADLRAQRRELQERLTKQQGKYDREQSFLRATEEELGRLQHELDRLDDQLREAEPVRQVDGQQTTGTLNGEVDDAAAHQG